MEGTPTEFFHSGCDGELLRQPVPDVHRARGSPAAETRKGPESAGEVWETSEREHKRLKLIKEAMVAALHVCAAIQAISDESEGGGTLARCHDDRSVARVGIARVGRHTDLRT